MLSCADPSPAEPSPDIMSGRRDPHAPDSHARTEPTLGNLDLLDTAPTPVDSLPHVRVEARSGHAERPRQAAHRPRRGWRIPLILLLVLGALIALWLGQNRLRALLPSTAFNDVLNQAQQALQSGHLDGHDGTSARELFQAAIALQPDNNRARDGLHQVGEAELSQADAALQAGRLDQATQLAAQARELLGGGSDVDRLDHAINAARGAKVQAVDLVTEAQQALAAGKLDGPQGAGALYGQVLQAEPGNPVAAHGLDQVGDALAARARTALAAHDSAAAAASIDQLAALQPSNGALPSLRAAQAQAIKQDTAALTDALAQGEQALRDGRFNGPGDDTALAHFKAALALDPANPQALAGLGNVAQALTVQASAQMDAGDLTQAASLLDQAAALAPRSADLAAARARLRSLSQPPPAQSASTSLPMTAVSTLTPQQSAAVAQLVQRAHAAVERGDIMLPPGDCAYDLYRNALAIDGNNAAALRGLQSLPGQVQQLFNQALAQRQLVQADAMLSNLAQLSPGDPGQSALTDRLATAWLDQADRQLGRGDRIDAAQSLAHARKLEPNHPRVLELAARLQQPQ